MLLMSVPPAIIDRDGAATQERPAPRPNPERGSDVAESIRFHAGRRVARTGEWRLHSHGYVMVKMPEHPLASNGWVYEHRMVLFDAGIDPSGRHVHHLNGDKRDNRIENLQVIDSANHTRHHIATEVSNQYGTFARDAECCRSGHVWAGGNEYRKPNGERMCRACRRDQMRRQR